jgi:peptide/nickel transport system substrate-binding protein
MRKTAALLVLAVILATLVTGCAGGKRQVKDVFIQGTAGDAETLNWILAADSSSFSYASHTLDSLATYDNNLNIVLLCLAKDIEVSPDGLVYTITIRNDLKWTDGSPVTAEDYVYTLKNLMCSNWLNYPYASNWEEEVNGKKVYVKPEVVDATTFTITRQTVDAEFVYNIYDLIPLPKSIASKYEGDVKAFTEAPEFNKLTYTGNLGPYRYKEWIRNDRFVVERNPDYYLGKPVGAPYFEQYVTKIFGTSATRQAALEAGDITYTSIEPEQANRFRNLKTLQVHTVPSGGYVLLVYNQRNNGWEGLRNKKIRQALSMAIGKEALSQAVYLGFAEPAYSFIPKVSPWYNDESLVKYGTGELYDKNKAAEILYQEGYGAKKEDGTIKVTDKQGDQLKLVLATTTGSELTGQIAAYIQKEFKGMGIHVENKYVPWSMLIRQFMYNKVTGSDQEPGDNNGPDAVSEEPWDFMLMGFGTDVKAPSGSEVFFTADGGLNFFGFHSTEVDALFDKAKSKEALNENFRRQVYAELSHLISEEQPADFLAFTRSNLGFLKKVKGIEPGISIGYNYYLWYFE